MRGSEKRTPKWVKLNQLFKAFRIKEPRISLAAYSRYLIESLDIERPPVDIDSIVKALEIEVEYVTEPGWSGAVVAKGGKAKIWINKDESRTRQRFLLAHQLGHLLFNDNEEDMTFRCANMRGKEESVPNEFAAHLLVPHHWLEPASVWPWVTREKLAQGFEVSPHIMQMQLTDLYGGVIAW